MRPLRHDDPSGTPVAVTLDDGSIWHTWTRSETWTLGNNQVVLLKGKTGCYLVKRCHIDTTVHWGEQKS